MYQDFQHNISDIERTSPKKLFLGKGLANNLIDTNKKDCRYTTDDIEGSHSKVYKLNSARAGTTNPLNPKYKLPTYKPEPAPEPKFIRDGMAVDDIKGAQVAKPRAGNNRNTLEVADIQGIKSSAKNNNNQQNARDKLSAADIEGAHPQKLKVKMPGISCLGKK